MQFLFFAMEGIGVAVSVTIRRETAGEPRRSYNEMLADSAWLADWEGALETLQDMRSLGVTPDVTSDLVDPGGSWWPMAVHGRGAGRFSYSYMTGS